MNKNIDQLIKELRQKLLKDFYKQIVDITRPGTHKKGINKLMGFILGSILIDYLAGFYEGATQQSKSSPGQRYICFVIRYMPLYHARHLWHDVRSRLVHFYSVGADYGFTHMEEDGKHFSKVPHSNGKTLTILNLEDFLKDIKEAGNTYLADLKKDKSLQKKALDRRKSLGLIDYIKPL